MQRVFLKKGRERPVLQGHPWIFSGAIEKAEAEPECAGITDVFDHMSGCSTHADLSDQPQDNVLSVNGLASLTLELNPHGFRLLLQQTTSRQDVSDFGSADAKRQGAKRTVSRGMRITTYDRHSRLCDTKLRTNYVNNSLPFIEI